jgi:uncharacterized protein YdeI (YjbR/CyaY-like superfamily)
MAKEKKPAEELPTLVFEDQQAWEAWLENNHDSLHGAWLVFSKKGAKTKSVTYGEAVETALCYGWIDSQAKSLDEFSYLQKFTQRGPKSIWSKINRAKALELIKQGRMKPAGLAAIETAKENGRWKNAYDSFRTVETPLDLQAALDKHPSAAEFFGTLNTQNRYAILFRIQTARKAETRQKRIEKFISMLEKHEKLYP